MSHTTNTLRSISVVCIISITMHLNKWGHRFWEGVPNIYYGYAGPSRGGQKTAKLTQADREALAETNAAALESCGGLAPDVTNLPYDRVRRVVKVTTDQEAALDDLKSASDKANDIVKASRPAHSNQPTGGCGKAARCDDPSSGHGAFAPCKLL